MPENLKYANGQLALALAHLERQDKDIRRRVGAAREQLRGTLFESDLPYKLRPTLESIAVAEVDTLDPVQLLCLAEEITGLAWVVHQQVERVAKGEHGERASRQSKTLTA